MISRMGGQGVSRREAAEAVVQRAVCIAYNQGLERKDHVVAMTMHPDGKQPASRRALILRRASGLVSIPFLVLGLSVFLWGTAYKLSLYKPPQKDRVPAKLCTRGGDLAKKIVHDVVAWTPASKPKPDLLTFRFSLQEEVESPGLGCVQTVDRHPPPWNEIGFSPHHTFRPPPASLRANV